MSSVMLGSPPDAWSVVAVVRVQCGFWVFGVRLHMLLVRCSLPGFLRHAWPSFLGPALRQRGDEFRQQLRIERLFYPAGRSRRARRRLEWLAGFGGEHEDRRVLVSAVRPQCGDQVEAA